MTHATRALRLGLAIAAGSPAAAATFAPDAIVGSGLTVRVTQVDTPYTPFGQNNLAAPKVVDGQLHFIDQRGRVSRQTEAGFQTVLDFSDAGQRPDGFVPDARVAVLDVAEGPGNTVYVATTSTGLPTDAPTARALPNSPDYSTAPTYQLIYRYTRAPDGTLTDPVALASFEAGVDHSGGAMLGLDSGDVLFATGDSLPFGTDGRAAPQDPASHVGSILRINGATGAVDVVAKGVRNVQRLTWADADRSTVAFSDLGGVVAEEVNTVPLDDLLDLGTVENFGWGRNADGNAREGTFYIDTGTPLITGTPEALGRAPLGEAGFLQPYAEWGREDARTAAISGPVFAPISFQNIEALFGDLGSGRLFATRTGVEDGPASVFAVNVVDASGAPTDLLSLSGFARADVRFFNFVDGGAGVLLERAGAAYRLTELTAVPLPATLWAMLAGIVALRWRRRGSVAAA